MVNLPTTPNGGSVTVYNEAGYTTQFYVSFRYNGQDYITWTNPFTLFYSKTINFPNGTTNVKLVVFYLTISQYWETLYTATFDVAPIVCYKAWGPVWNPEISNIPCNSTRLSNGWESNPLHGVYTDYLREECTPNCCK
ncbi:MAG: hypothetical protein RR840_01040 [Clostridium sp.]